MIKYLKLRNNKMMSIESVIGFFTARIAFPVILAAAAMSSSSGAAAVVDIPVGASSEEIVQAVASAEDGSVVRFPAGTWSVTNTIVLAKAVSVEGAGPESTVLDFGGKCRGFKLSDAGARVAGLKIFRCAAYGDKVNIYGGGVKMSDGTVTNCLIEACTVSGTKGKIHLGGGVYITGGLVTGCEIRGCKFEELYGLGNAVYMKGGRVEGCDIHANDGGFSHPSAAYGGAVVFVEKGGVFENSKVHHNFKDTNPGVHVWRGGTIRNCLIYGNRGKYGAGGVYMDDGTVEFCTVVGNEVSERPDRSGIWCHAGTVRNSIFWANGQIGGCEARSGATVEHNVFDRALGDYPDNRVSDPLFANAAGGDFSIYSRFSSAYGYAVPVPGVVGDITGGLRKADAPTCGAFEFDPSDETFGADVVFAQSDFAAGSDVSVEASVSGVEFDDVSVVWTVDGVKRPESGRVLTLRGLSLGSHSVRLEVVRKTGGEKVVRDYPGRIRVFPTVCYVNMSGSGTAPFDTFEKGTNSLEAVLAVLGTSASVTSVVHVAGGSYTLSDGVIVKDKIRILGEGRDVVTFYCPEARAFTLENDAAEVRGVTVNGGSGAFEVVAGRVVSCRAQNIQTSQTYGNGAGFRMVGGEVIDCEALDCSSHGISSGGGGLFIADGLVSNLLVRNCRGYDFKTGAGAVFVCGGVLKGVTITGTDMANVDGCALLATPKDGRSVVLDSCVVTGCTSEYSGVVRLVNVNARNCLFAGNVGRNGIRPTVNIHGGTFENCTFSGNSNPSAGLSAVDVVARKCVFSEDGGVNSLSGRFEGCFAPSLSDGVDGNTSTPPAAGSGIGCDEALKGGI